MLRVLLFQNVTRIARRISSLSRWQRSVSRGFTKNSRRVVRSRGSVEGLECRWLPAVIAVFDPNLLELQVTATGDDAIVIGADSLGNLLVNGSTVTASVLLAKAADVQQIVVNPLPAVDGPGANLIDLTGVTKSVFRSLTDGNVVLDGGIGDDTILGSQFADVIWGDFGSDRLDGGLGADTVQGGDGNDTLFAGLSLGNDSLDGDQGVDLVRFLGTAVGDLLTISAAGLRFHVNGSTQMINAGGVEQLDLLSGTGNDSVTVENLTGVADLTSMFISSEAGSDVVDASALLAGLLTLSVDGGTESDLIRGSAGDDSLTGSSGNDTLFGNDGADFLNGMDGNDEIHAGAGHDYLLGGADLDVLFGDDGNDFVRGQGSADTLSGGTGNDFIDGEEGNNTLIETGDVNFVLTDSVLTGLGTDQLSGMTFAAMLTGGNGANRIDARSYSGQVTLNGGAGNDTLLGTANADMLLGGSGNDLLAGYGENDLLNGNDGQDSLFGGTGNDTLLGGADADVLLGEEGDDRVMGQGNSNDTLNGGPGNDTYDGSTSEINESFTFDLNALLV